MAVRVALAEDDYLVREGIQRLLEREPEIGIVGVYGTGEELLAGLADDAPDVVLTDIRMPPDHSDEGIQLSRRLRESYPHIGVIVLSSYIEPRYALRVFEDGAEGRAYMLKQHLGSREELVRAIQEVAAGGSVVDPRVVEALVDARRRTDSAIGRLTPRELEVLGLVAQGASNDRIARLLVLSKGAVEKHINSIFGKLDLSDEPDVSRRVKAALFYLGRAP